jgi:hypothetical protein
MGMDYHRFCWTTTRVKRVQLPNDSHRQTHKVHLFDSNNDDNDVIIASKPAHGTHDY